MLGVLGGLGVKRVSRKGAKSAKRRVGFSFPNPIPLWYPTDKDLEADLDKSSQGKRR